MPDLQISGWIVKSKKRRGGKKKGKIKKGGQSFLFCVTMDDQVDGVMHWEIQPQCRVLYS